jgi:hypothetical protein
VGGRGEQALVIIDFKGTGGRRLGDKASISANSRRTFFPPASGSRFVPLNAISNESHAAGAGWAVDEFGGGSAMA